LPEVIYIHCIEAVGVQLDFSLMRQRSPMLNKRALKDHTKIEVWDPLLRCFHWLLLLCFLISWWSEGRDIRVHMISGSVMAGLLLFRLIWGVTGERNALFVSFFPSITDIRQHIGELLNMKSGDYMAHTPVGSVMIFLLLICLIVLTGTGMALMGLQAGVGLFAAWSATAAFESELLIQNIHAWCFNMLLFLTAIHLLGVLVESLLQRRNLVMAMITGKKLLPGSDYS